MDGVSICSGEQIASVDHGTHGRVRNCSLKLHEIGCEVRMPEIADLSYKVD